VFIALGWVAWFGGAFGEGAGRSSPAPPVVARLLFLGDTSFGENYQERLAMAGGKNVLKQFGYDHMMANFRGMLEGASLAVANLETPVTDLGSSPLGGRKRYIHYADVEETPRHLAGSGVHLVSLANNHAMDFGAAGLAQTTASLQRQGIATCGAGGDELHASRPYRHEVDLGAMRVLVAIICAFEFSEHYDREFRFYAGLHTAGVNSLAVSKVMAQVQALRREDPTVFVIVFPHWGRNYHQVTANQRRLGHALIDAGADLIIGHGAHLLQGLERYRGRWIAYGIGNFVFGSPGRYALFGAPPYSAIAELAFEARNSRITKMLRFYPIVTDNTVTGYRGRFVTDDEHEGVSHLLATHSRLETSFGALVRQGRNGHGRHLEVQLD
jgi:hypothetical protein